MGVTTPLLQIRGLRFREVRDLPEVTQRQNRSRSGLPTSGPVLFSLPVGVEKGEKPL